MGVFDSYSLSAQNLVQKTYDLAQNSNHNPVHITHLFAILVNQSLEISDILQDCWLDLKNIKNMTQQSLATALSADGSFSISQQLNDIFEQANSIAQQRSKKQTEIYDIFLSLLKSDTNINNWLKDQWITYDKVRTTINKKSEVTIWTNKSPELLSSNKYLEDLTQLAKNWKLREIIGRDKELRKIIEMLWGKEKNNVMILGEPGVGKTAIVELLAQKIVAWEVPDFLKDKKIMKINLGSLISWSKYRGEFEERITSIIQTVKDSNGQIILFINEIHNISWAGKTEGSMDLWEILKPELSSGNIQAIWATTTEEYHLNLEKNTALTRRFGKITLQEPTVQETMTILRWIEWSFEQHHGVKIYDSALIAAVELTDKYIKDRKLPDKAIAVLDQAATKVKIAKTSLPEFIEAKSKKIKYLNMEIESILQEISLTTDMIQKDISKQKIDSLNKEITELNDQYTKEKSLRENIKAIREKNNQIENDINNKNSEEKQMLEKQLKTNQSEIEELQKNLGISFKDSVEKEDITTIVSETTWIPLTKMEEEESQRFLQLEKYLSTKVVWQDDAISAISNAIRRARAWLKDPKKPIWSFIFLWSTWVGKTELAKALAEFLFLDKNAMIRLNMSEFQEKESASKLIWSAPWYIWYEEWWKLTEAVKRKPYSIILLDEVEKAHQNVFDLFLQVFDDGILNDSHGTTIDFKNTVIIMTSNIWSHEIMERLQLSEETIGDLYPIEEIKENGEKKKRNRRPKKKSENTEDNSSKQNKTEEIKEVVQPLLLDFFRPEFLNRLDDNVIFNPISPEMLKKILDIKLKQKQELIYESKRITLEFSNEVKNFLAKKSRDPANWARPIDRALQKYVIDALSKEILSDTIKEWDTIKAFLQENTIKFSK